jgi:hypothetical protein
MFTDGNTIISNCIIRRERNNIARNVSSAQRIGLIVILLDRWKDGQR